MTAHFGRDTWCRRELRPGRYAEGLELVAENAFHRLITERGKLRGGPDEQSYGLGLENLIGAVDFDSGTLPGQIRGELLKDERIDDVRADVTVATEGPAEIYAIAVRCFTGAGPFTLRIAASEVTVELLGLEVG